MRPLPTKYPARPNNIVAQRNFRITDHGRLRAKLLVFQNNLALRRFWGRWLPREYRQSLGRRCLGAVSGLTSWTQQIGEHDEGRLLLRYQDPRYFCVIALIATNLTMEVVSHESVHAGFCYAKRVKQSPWSVFSDFDEEEVAYPAGLVATAINRFLYAKKLYRDRLNY